MKHQLMGLTAIVFVAFLSGCTTQTKSNASAPRAEPVAVSHASSSSTQASHGHDDMHGDMHTAGTAAKKKRVPAHYENAASIRVLPLTLAPEGFSGRAREGYQAARAIPKTLAQLPCYCYCDEGFGHKSLHSCFEDAHGSQCGVCVDEALFAYKLEKEQRLSPAEIREAVNKRFGPK